MTSSAAAKPSIARLHASLVAASGSQPPPPSWPFKIGRFMRASKLPFATPSPRVPVRMTPLAVATSERDKLPPTTDGRIFYVDHRL